MKWREGAKTKKKKKKKEKIRAEKEEVNTKNQRSGSKLFFLVEDMEKIDFTFDGKDAEVS